jgi:hypothetical protein
MNLQIYRRIEVVETEGYINVCVDLLMSDECVDCWFNG